MVEFKTKEETGKSFPMTAVRAKPNQTPVTEEPEVMKTIKDTQKQITEIYQEQSYDDLKEVLNNFLNQESDVSDSDMNMTAVKTPAKAEKVEDVSSAFDDLFNN